MLLVVILAATTALTLGLVLHGVTAQPYQQTRHATAGPDVVATAFPEAGGSPSDLAGLNDVAHLAHAPGVVGFNGPFPVAFPVLRANGHADAVLAEGRDSAPASVDQPKLTEGSLWGSRTRSPVLTWYFYAARSYSLMRLPSTGQRLIRFRERFVAG